MPRRALTYGSSRCRVHVHALQYTHPLEHSPGSSGGHYGDDAYTYMNVGEAMGTAMVKLLKGEHKY